MKAAVNLFSDRLLLKLISSFSVSKGRCDFSFQENVDVFDLSESQIIANNLATIINFYSPANGDDKNGKPLYVCLIKEWCIFSSDVKEEAILGLLTKIFEVNQGIIDTSILIQTSYISDAEGEGKDYYSLIKNNDWNAFSNEIKFVNRFHTDSFNFKQFDSLLSALIEPINANRFYRGRVSSKEGYQEGEMRTPPSQYAKSSRVSPAFISTLYLCSDINCVPNECRAVCNDYITIAEFNLNGKYNSFDLRKIDSLSPFDFPGEELFIYYNKMILKQLITEIEKPMTSIDNECDYIPIQYLCEYMKHFAKKNSGNRIVGIVYKSVMASNKDVFNLAAFSEDGFSFSGSKVYRIKEYKPVLVPYHKPEKVSSA